MAAYSWGALIRAAVFDFDGVLVDSESLHFEALRDALGASGTRIDEDEYKDVLLAFDDRTSVRVALERRGQPHDRDRIETIARDKAARFEEAKRKIRPFPGAERLVSFLASRVPLAIASGALHDEIEQILEAARLRERFAAIVGADDVDRWKPHPEPYLAAVRRLAATVEGLAPHECLAFEDSVAGIASARTAGLRVIGVAHTYPQSKLALAHLVVPSLAALDPADVFERFNGEGLR